MSDGHPGAVIGRAVKNVGLGTAVARAARLEAPGDVDGKGNGSTSTRGSYGGPWVKPHRRGIRGESLTRMRLRVRATMVTYRVVLLSFPDSIEMSISARVENFESPSEPVDLTRNAPFVLGGGIRQTVRSPVHVGRVRLFYFRRYTGAFGWVCDSIVALYRRTNGTIIRRVRRCTGFGQTLRRRNTCSEVIERRTLGDNHAYHRPADRSAGDPRCCVRDDVLLSGYRSVLRRLHSPREALWQLRG